MTYKDNILVLISFIEINLTKTWENHKDLPYNATIKVVVRDLIEQTGLIYTRPLGSFVREIVTFPNTPAYVAFKRDLIGLSIEEAIFGDAIIKEWQHHHSHLNNSNKKIIIMKYKIEWVSGASQIIEGTNYINALYTNHIDECMEHNIVSHKPLFKNLAIV